MRCTRCSWRTCRWIPPRTAEQSSIAPGALIGIANQVSSQLARPGLTYVTPIDTAMADMYAMIKAGGQAEAHPWLGILQATDISGPGAQELGVAGAIEVESVAVGSPAAKAGIADNDVITAIAGHPAASVGALIAWMALAKPGEVVSVDWLHSGHRHQADITLGTQPATLRTRARALRRAASALS